jgi:hypothetical protein
VNEQIRSTSAADSAVFDVEWRSNSSSNRAITSGGDPTPDDCSNMLSIMSRTPDTDPGKAARPGTSGHCPSIVTKIKMR